MAGADAGNTIEGDRRDGGDSGASGPAVGAGGGNGRAVGYSDGRGAGAVAQLRAGGAIAGIVPTTIEEVFRLANAIAKSGLAPRDMATAEKLTVAILQGLEIGIPPMMAVNKIAVVNGRPALWGDALPAILWSKRFKLHETFRGTGDQHFAECVVVRPDGEEITRQFSVADAKIAGLWGKPGPWKQYPDRMLQMRARGLAARDGAADVLAGIYTAEEAMDVAPPPDRPEDLFDAPPMSGSRKTSAQAKRDGDDVSFNELRGAISGVDTLDELGTLEAAHAEFLLSLPHGWARIVTTEINDRRRDLSASEAAP